MMWKLAPFLLAVVVAFGGCADEGGDGVGAIREGMTSTEVRKVAGPPTKVLPDNNGPEPGGVPLWLYRSFGSQSGWFGVTFDQDGHVISAGETLHR